MKIPSPLNYLGGKYRLLPQILPILPVTSRNFMDLFCGGCNVGINACAERIYFNDNNRFLIGLLRAFQQLEITKVLERISELIVQYGLSDSSRYGYEYYACNGSDGLTEFNKIPFLNMREDFNCIQKQDSEYFIRLYVLIVFAFNNQMRFNRHGKFNLPVGKRDFNIQMKSKLIEFMKRLQDGNYFFSYADFRDVDFSQYSEEDFVYVDPPYLITCATYNEQNGWNEKDEMDLLNFLNGLDRRGIRFALSNVLHSKGKENRILLDWIDKQQKYRIHFLDFHYANSNYQTKDKTRSSCEVLITNY